MRDLPECDCAPCRVLAAAIDRDLRARLEGRDPREAAAAVREAAELVDVAHRLDRPVRGEVPR